MAPESRNGWGSWLRWTAILEVAAMAAFALVVGVLAALRPDYSHAAQTISALGEIGRPYAYVQTLNFIVLGAPTIVFGYGLHRGLPPGSPLGPALVALFGVGAIGAGLFPCFPCGDFSAYTWENTTHGVAAGVAFVAIMPAPFFLARRMRSNPEGGAYARPLAILGVLIVALNVGYYVATETDVAGALQRALVGTIFVVFGLLAVRLYRMGSA